MGRGGKIGNQHRGNGRIRSKDKVSDDSDEDYTVGADEDLEDSGEDCSSLAGEESEGWLDEFEEEEEEEVKKVSRSKGQKVFAGRMKSGAGGARKNARVSCTKTDDEDYEDDGAGDDDDDDAEFAPNEIELDDEDELPVRKKNKVDYHDDNNDDDDDEEFMPNEIDLDDEDEFPVRKKDKKVGRRPLQEKGFVSLRKRKRSHKVVKKPIPKKPTKNRGSQRNSDANSDGAVEKRNNTAVKARSANNSGTRKRRFMVDSDSDFVCSDLSDFDITISEEEREQVREASELCDYLTPSLRNSHMNKRLGGGVLCQKGRRMGRKGKDKIEDKKDESGKQVCGICFSEEGQTTIRGTLNCCSHYFCFTCIMEWSKVESRCPMCKQRFVTITKPARSNAAFDLRTATIQVPERDQVYQPSEEELRGYLDPYENVICTECQQGGDDALMLLCDLCDSPAHTYCVGLGHDVPEGSWYCEGCRPTALGSSGQQAPNPTPERRAVNDFFRMSPPIENVREAIDLNTEYVPETPLTQVTGGFPSPRRPGGDFQAASPVSGAGVSTVSGRRRLRLQMRHLLNSRMIPGNGRGPGMPATTFGNNFMGPQTESGRIIASQHAITPGTLALQQAFSQGGLQDSFTPSGRSWYPFPSRSSHSTGPLIRGHTSTSTDVSVNGMLPAGYTGINMDSNSRMGSEQLHPCSTRSSISDPRMSPYGYGERTVPSRTLHRTLHTPF